MPVNRNIPAKDQVTEKDVKTLSSNVSSLVTAVHNFTKQSINLTKTIASSAVSPVTQSVNMLGREAQLDVSKTMAIGAAARFNPVLGYFIDKLIDENKDAIKSGFRNSFMAVNNFLTTGFTNLKENLINRRNENESGQTIINNNIDNTPKRKRIHRLQLTSYNKTYGSNDITEAIDLLRMSNAEWLKALAVEPKEKLKKKSIPKAATGGYVSKTGQAIVHKGELIVPSKVLGMQLNYLGTIVDILSKGVLKVSIYKDPYKKLMLKERIDTDKLHQQTKITFETAKLNKEISNTVSRLYEQSRETLDKTKILTSMWRPRRFAELILNPFRAESTGFLAQINANLEHIGYIFGIRKGSIIGNVEGIPFFQRLSMAFGRVIKSSPLVAAFFRYNNMISELLQKTIGRLFFFPLMKFGSKYGVKGKTPLERIQSATEIGLDRAIKYYNETKKIFSQFFKGSTGKETKEQQPWTIAGKIANLFTKPLNISFGKKEVKPPDKNSLAGKVWSIENILKNLHITLQKQVEKEKKKDKKERTFSQKTKIYTYAFDKKLDKFLNVFQEKESKLYKKIDRISKSTYLKTSKKVKEQYISTKEKFSKAKQFLTPYAQYAGMTIKEAPSKIKDSLFKQNKSLLEILKEEFLQRKLARREEEFYRKQSLRWMRKNDESKKGGLFGTLFSFMLGPLAKLGKFFGDIIKIFKTKGFLGVIKELIIGKKGLIPKIKALFIGEKGILPRLKTFFIGEKGLFPRIKNFFIGRKGLITRIRIFLFGKKGLFPRIKNFFVGEKSIFANLKNIFKEKGFKGLFKEIFVGKRGILTAIKNVFVGKSKFSIYNMLKGSIKLYLKPFAKIFQSVWGLIKEKGLFSPILKMVKSLLKGGGKGIIKSLKGLFTIARMIIVGAKPFAKLAGTLFKTAFKASPITLLFGLYESVINFFKTDKWFKEINKGKGATLSQKISVVLGSFIKSIFVDIIRLPVKLIWAGYKWIYNKYFVSEESDKIKSNIVDNILDFDYAKWLSIHIWKLWNHISGIFTSWFNTFGGNKENASLFKKLSAGALAFQAGMIQTLFWEPIKGIYNLTAEYMKSSGWQEKLSNFFGQIIYGVTATFDYIKNYVWNYIAKNPFVKFYKMIKDMFTGKKGFGEAILSFVRGTVEWFVKLIPGMTKGMIFSIQKWIYKKYPTIGSMIFSEKTIKRIELEKGMSFKSDLEKRMDLKRKEKEIYTHFNKSEYTIKHFKRGQKAEKEEYKSLLEKVKQTTLGRKVISDYKKYRKIKSEDQLIESASDIARVYSRLMDITLHGEDILSPNIIKSYQKRYPTAYKEINKIRQKYLGGKIEPIEVAKRHERQKREIEKIQKEIKNKSLKEKTAIGIVKAEESIKALPSKLKAKGKETLETAKILAKHYKEPIANKIVKTDQTITQKFNTYNEFLKNKLSKYKQYSTSLIGVEKLTADGKRFVNNTISDLQSSLVKQTSFIKYLRSKKADPSLIKHMMERRKETLMLLQTYQDIKKSHTESAIVSGVSTIKEKGQKYIKNTVDKLKASKPSLKEIGEKLSETAKNIGQKVEQSSATISKNIVSTANNISNSITNNNVNPEDFYYKYVKTTVQSGEVI